MRWMPCWRILRSLSRCCLGKVDLLMAGGAAEVLPVHFNSPLPLLRTHPPSLLVCSFLVLAEMGATSIISGRYIGFYLRSGWKQPLWYNPSFSCIENLKILHSQPFAAIFMQTKQDPRETVLLMALKIMLHAKLSLSDHISYLRVLASRKYMHCRDHAAFLLLAFN
jgi:hypothetical protein